MNPSPEQDEIIHSSGNTIVISNPGTGKTTTLSLKVVKLLENGLNPENILCITFTEKAKKEMFEKIFQMAKAKFSDSDIMKLNIHTFHSFAYNYLLDSGLITGDIVGNNVMRYSILRSFEENNAFNYSKDYLISTIVPKTENAIRYIKSFGITPDMIQIESVNSLIEKMDIDYDKTSYTLQELKAFLNYFVSAYNKYENSKQGAIDYSDMLLLFVNNFKGKKFDYVLVDEMQDMNDIEAKIAQRVGNNIFLVGDAKQAIFGFQGGSIKNFQEFKQTCDEKLLSLNRRSCQQILDYSKNHFLTRTQNRVLFEKELECFRSLETGTLPMIISTNAHLSKIMNIIEENPGKTIGIITRTNRQIIEISQYLDINNIKYSSTSSQATTEQAKNEILAFLRGLMNEKVEDKLIAAYTIFSPYSLKEAFELSEMYNNNGGEKLNKLKTWGISMKKIDIDTLFNNVIFPVCVTKGAEWFSTAISIKKQIEQYLIIGIPSKDGLFDFLSITEESYIERDVGSKITLTTVHKAKGRAFDIVAYLPYSRTERTGFVNIIVEAILKSQGVNIREELEEESLRVDFVAFTRAIEKLIIIVDTKNAKKYHVENLCENEIDDKENETIATKLDARLSEAFSLFVAGRFQDSEKLLKLEDEWLAEFIINYFKNIDHFSYSSIKTDPYDFLIENIIAIPTFHPATDFGSKTHKALASLYKEKSIVDSLEPDVKRAVENGTKAIDQLKKEYPGLKLVAVEKRRQLPLSSMIDFDDKNLMFTGFIDAIFQHDNGYIIVDYKTDKNTNSSSDHKRQLAVYRKMHSILENIAEDKIKIFVIFVAIRGGINTGRFEWAIEKENRDTFPTFEKHLRTVLEWKHDSKKFIKDLLDDPKDDLLYQTIKEKLLKSTI